MFSKACEYAIKAVLYIAYSSKREERVGVKKIAKAIDSPEAFTGKIMQQLSKNKIVSSIKGPSGGFWIGEEQRKSVNIMEIVKVIDGDKLYTACGLGLTNCNDHHPCPVHEEYAKIKAELIKMHTETSIDDLSGKLDENATLK